MIGGLDSHCLPRVCMLVRDTLPPPPFQASTPVRVCILPHRPRHDIGARALISQFLSVLTPSPSACRFYVGLPSTLLIPRPRAVALAGVFDAVVAAVTSPGPPPEPQCDSSCCIVNACWFCCLPDAVRALLADAAPTARPCDVEAKANGSRDAQHIAWCVRLLRVVGAS